MAGSLKFLALSAAAAIALGLGPASAGAFAQQAPAASTDSGMRLNGGVRLSAAYDPIEIGVPELIAAPGLSAREPASASASAVADTTVSEDSGSASALPWYQRFTGAPAEPQILWSESESFEMQAGDRWGVTLGYSQGERSPQSFNIEDFRAGAFFELTERVRLGGQLRFTSPEEEIFGEETEERAPEVRFESAFKF